MGNLLLRVIGAAAILVAIVLLIGTFLPRDFESQSSVVIDAAPEEIFPYLNRIKWWSEWSPWNEHEIADLNVDYSGPKSGVGAVQTWTEPRGSGKLWITESVENQRIAFRSTFANFPEMQSQITLEVVDEGTRISWTSKGALPGGPFYGWFGTLFSNALSEEFRKSLSRLKRLCESDDD